MILQYLEAYLKYLGRSYIIFKYLRMQGAKSSKGGFKILANIRSKGALDLICVSSKPVA